LSRALVGSTVSEREPVSARIKRRHAVGLAATWVAAAGSARAAEAAGSVETLRGEAFAMAAAARRALALASQVFVGDSVVTGDQSALGLHLGTATEIRLGPDAQLRIDRFLVNVGGVLDLARGNMVFDHPAAAGGIDVTVRSPFGLIAVRGTQFFAGTSNGVFGVFVIEGAVQVVGSGTSVEVTKGLGTDIVRANMDPTNPHPWGAARIEAALASVR
jgi:hypothetical protein